MWRYEPMPSTLKTVKFGSASVAARCMCNGHVQAEIRVKFFSNWWRERLPVELDWSIRLEIQDLGWHWPGNHLRTSWSNWNVWSVPSTKNAPERDCLALETSTSRTVTRGLGSLGLREVSNQVASTSCKLLETAKNRLWKRRKSNKNNIHAQHSCSASPPYATSCRPSKTTEHLL